MYDYFQLYVYDTTKLFYTTFCCHDQIVTVAVKLGGSGWHLELLQMSNRCKAGLCCHFFSVCRHRSIGINGEVCLYCRYEPHEELFSIR